MEGMRRPNILFILTDDHAAHAMSCYGSRINQTPHLDRIAGGGALFRNCFCTNSICAPSRASILTGTYNHINGVTTLATPFDGRQATFPKVLQEAGYQTAIFGKWHLGHGGHADPTGFDEWEVFPGQGDYHDPEMLTASGARQHKGYATDLVTDMSLDWLRQRDRERPFLLCCHHKAPHRPWEPDEAHADMYADEDIPEPETLFDDYSNRSEAAKVAQMRINRDMGIEDLKEECPEGLSFEEETRWKYQRYIKDYLRCVASVDDNVGRLLDYLDEEGISNDTIVIYTSDQGFFLGDHGWYDKRFMYEESLRMPMVMRYPAALEAGTVIDSMVLNVDFAPTLLELCQAECPADVQGRSFVKLLQGKIPADWRDSMYYRYWMHGTPHAVKAHYGVRTHDFKLIHYYADPLDQPGTSETAPRTQEWELFDLRQDPAELNNVYADPEYSETVKALKEELFRLQAEIGDKP